VTAIIVLKPNVGINSPQRVVNVMAILTTPYSTKFVQKSNRIVSFENCDLQNVMLENMGK
jgi:hypothetical protein